MKNIKLRIDNIELRKTLSVFGNDYYEIVKWYPNENFGKQDYYEWSEDHKMWYKMISGVRCYLDEHHFTTPEFCYTVATIKDSTEEPDVVSVGSRTAELNDQEWSDYHKIIKFFYDNYYECEEESD